jgi:hypothetical protein
VSEKTPQKAPYEQLLAGQKDLAGQLEDLVKLAARELRSPSVRIVQFGEGQEPVQVLNGELDAAYRGVAIFNPTNRKIQFDTTRRSSSDTAMHVPSKSWLVWPIPFGDLTLAVAAGEAGGAVDSVVVLRLWVQPSAPAAGAWS